VLERWLGAAPAVARPAVAQNGGPALVDDARLRVFRDDYPEIVEQLVGLFVDSTPPLLRELRAAAENDDAAALKQASHKLKGSCQNIGASGMAAETAAIERAAAATAEQLDRLEITYDRTCAALRAALIPVAG
jgi:two-component system sensor histidine kinase/response regulator